LEGQGGFETLAENVVGEALGVLFVLRVSSSSGEGTDGEKGGKQGEMGIFKGGTERGLALGVRGIRFSVSLGFVEKYNASR